MRDGQYHRGHRGFAGIDEDDIEVQLFEDALVVEGRRELPACSGDARYHAAGVSQGQLRLLSWCAVM